jgi:hypothetical protein
VRPQTTYSFEWTFQLKVDAVFQFIDDGFDENVDSQSFSKRADIQRLIGKNQTGEHVNASKGHIWTRQLVEQIK